MRLTRHSATRRSFISMDVIAALGLTAFALLIATAGARHYVFARLDSDARRLVRVEAETALARARAGLPQRDLSRIPHGVELEVQRSPGRGAWTGLTLVRVKTAKQTLGGRWIRTELTTYTHSPEATP